MNIINEPTIIGANTENQEKLSNNILLPPITKQNKIEIEIIIFSNSDFFFFRLFKRLKCLF